MENQTWKNFNFYHTAYIYAASSAETPLINATRVDRIYSRLIPTTTQSNTIAICSYNLSTPFQQNIIHFGPHYTAYT